MLELDASLCSVPGGTVRSLTEPVPRIDLPFCRPGDAPVRRFFVFVRRGLRIGEPGNFVRLAAPR